jgi:hypothetical protein
MTNIDYKVEVKAIHENAFEYEHSSGGYLIVTFKFGETFNILSEHMMTELGAWQNAYENLKKEGRIL